MSELGLVFITEIARKIRSRLFWIATVGGVLAIAAVIEAPILFSGVARSTTGDIVLSGDANLRARATVLLEARHDYRVVASVATLPAHVNAAYLDAHAHAGAAIAIARHGARIHLDIYPRDLSAFDGAQFRALVPLNIELRTGATPASAREAAVVERSLHAIDAKFADSGSATAAHGIAFGLIFMLYLAIILASQNVMAAVAEEKTSRIAEILVATIEPANLLAGKTFAAAIIALVQIGLWIVTAALLLPQLASSLADSTRTHPGGLGADVLGAIDPLEIVAFFAFFVLGYLQYATIYAAAASLISRTEDLASVTTPVLMPVIGAFFVAQYALLQPNAPFVIACSFLPFLSPFVMFTRITISTVPLWQTALALGINLATVLACFWVAGKIYRVGMLLYGRLPSPKQIFAALRA